MVALLLPHALVGSQGDGGGLSPAIGGGARFSRARAGGPLGSWRWLNRDWTASQVLGPYRSYASLFVPLRPDDEFVLWQEDEIRLYRDLLLKSVNPRYFLLELTAYPLAAASAWIETEHRRLYSSFDLWDGFNLLRSLGAGYQEPWSVSVFLGQLTNFWDIDEQDELIVAAAGAAGLVVTAGLHQLFDNSVVSGAWYRVEWKIKGSGSVGGRRRSWDLKAGYRHYGQPLLANTVGIAMTRQRIDKGSRSLAPGKNSVLTIETQLPTAALSDGPARIALEYGKYYPVGKWLVGLRAGYLYENRREFIRETRSFSPTKQRLREYYLQPMIIL
ncbi:MAG: hypothetical protein V3U35_03240 [Candidatus Neomarinimicrobiota bacterium]